MTRAIACLALSALALAACSKKAEDAATSNATPAAAPAAALKPQVGLWEAVTQMQMPVAGAPAMKMSMQVCIDEASLRDDGWVQGGQQQSVDGTECSRAVTPAPGGYSVKTTCTAKGGGVTNIDSHITGDFKTRYSMANTIHVQGGPAQAQAADIRSTGEFRYLGPCPAGQAGGLVPGSMKMAAG
jgi:hypothetical protein